MILGANRELRAVGVVALGSAPSVMPKILNPAHFLCIEVISSGREMLYETAVSGPQGAARRFFRNEAMMRVVSGTVAAVALAVGMVSALPASADTISRDTLSRKFLDYCVNTQYRVEGIDRNSMIDRCRKASAEAMAQFEGDSFDAPSRAKFTAEQDKAIRSAVAAAFAKK